MNNKLYMITCTNHYFEIKTPSYMNLGDIEEGCCFIFSDSEDVIYDAVCKRLNLCRDEVDGNLFSLEFDTKIGCWLIIDDRGCGFHVGENHLDGQSFEKFISQWSF
ncbi:hypothetical protein GLP21_17630 [Photobacterium carnosum]|nr:MULTISPECIES: hypothetical protein [Photobacterium]MCD9476302.1 hypothetical protein [Photobacterium phosphoreum]MCD9488100.1 hypothetical protein [Photobacterium iliopiscarium]MCD9508078.1 hypothetical protein [Photobacterium phosphoreum]MCD9539183.1 hypothetical protein [Photobacterium carnosum]MCD9542347.1 hypothetical protein [Photobacterium carnosum]